ncbi:unnamed protein product [Sphagnum troendelagicum]|uniref:Uncharacterized protein n=1 Tax=Sphagnum troendelagicum TaxID=128251 RepID=A0ABP0TI86_9BRYO
MVAFWMAEMYPNFVKKMMISSSGVGFMSTSLDELLAMSNLSSISELMLPSSVKGMKVFLANVTYKAMWLLNFILHDMLQKPGDFIVPEGHCPSGRPPWVVCWGGFSGVHNISPPFTQQPSLNQ